MGSRRTMSPNGWRRSTTGMSSCRSSRTRRSGSTPKRTWIDCWKA